MNVCVQGCVNPHYLPVTRNILHSSQDSEVRLDAASELDLLVSTIWTELCVSTRSAVELQPTYCSQGVLGPTSLQKSGHASNNKV